MQSHLIDLERYFERIGYRGSTAPNQETLVALHERHVASIPFENLDVLLGRGVSLELDKIETKLVAQRRGGYCFEQNKLFSAVLEQLGYCVTPLIARVRWQAPAELTTPKTHMILRVEIDGRPQLADVGFGGVGLIRPIAIEAGLVQEEGQEPRRLVLRDGRYTHQVRLGEEWADVYEFLNTEAFPVDFELANWFTSTHPNSRFKLNLLATIVRDGSRIAVFNDELTTRSPDGSAEKSRIAGPERLREILRDSLGIELPRDEQIACPGFSWTATNEEPEA